MVSLNDSNLNIHIINSTLISIVFAYLTGYYDILDITWYITWYVMMYYMICYVIIWYVTIWRFTGYYDMHADVQVAVIQLPYLVSWEVEFPVLVQYRHNIRVQQQRRKGKQRRRTQKSESWHFSFFDRFERNTKLLTNTTRNTRQGKRRGG